MDLEGSNESVYKLGLMDTQTCVSENCVLGFPWWSSGLVQSLRHVQLFAPPWTTAQHQAFLSITNSWSLLTLTSIKLVMDSVPVKGYGFNPWLGNLRSRILQGVAKFFLRN